LIDRTSEGYDPEILCTSGLLLLREYDEKRSRNYCEVLKTYLENNMNIAKTIRKLYMQRATFLYQLKRITEISQLDLSDYPTRLHLMLSFEILQSSRDD
jgi:DNA-binding PucR family transcriptional regulator